MRAFVRPMLRRHLLVAASAGLLISRAQARTGPPLRILAYGDSNTWGWLPIVDGEPGAHHPDAVRWPGVMQRALGPAWRVRVNGLWGRTLDSDLPRGINGLTGDDHNGLKRLPLALLTETPVHLLVVMLGTNDLMAPLQKPVADVAQGVAALAARAAEGLVPHPALGDGPRLLLVAPPPLGETRGAMFADTFDAGSRARSRELPAALQAAAVAAGVPFFDAGSVITTDGVDGVHLGAAAHQVLGRALAAEVRRRWRGA